MNKISNTSAERRVLDILIDDGLVVQKGICYFGGMEEMMFRMKKNVEGIIFKLGYRIAEEEEERSMWGEKIFFSHLSCESPDNEEKGIGNSSGVGRYLKHNKDIGEVTGVKTPRELIVENIEKLKEIGIGYIDGVWYFGNAFGIKRWPKINGRSLSSFPSQEYNRTHCIGDKRGRIYSLRELKKMFISLGFVVATIEQEIERFRKTLGDARYELSKVGIKYITGTWYFLGVSERDTWPFILEKELKIYPNCRFNIRNKNGDERGHLNNPQHLKKMFQPLGFRVSTKEEEDIYYKAQLLYVKEQLSLYGIVYDSGTDSWTITRGKIQLAFTKVRVGGNILRCFPGKDFIISRGISKHGFIQSKPDLKRLFKELGFQERA